MSSKRIKTISFIMVFILLFSFIAEVIYAYETIPVRVGNQVFEVTPGQWVSVRQGTKIVHYNVRYINGRPVALEMSQYIKLIFNEPVAGTAAQPTTGSNVSGSNSIKNTSNSSSITSSKTSSSNAGHASSNNSGSITNGSTSLGKNNNLIWNEKTQRWHDPVTGRIVKGGPGPNSAGTTSGNTTVSNTNSTVSNTTNTSTNIETTTTSNNSNLVWNEKTQRWHDPVTGRIVKGGPGPSNSVNTNSSINNSITNADSTYNSGGGADYDPVLPDDVSIDTSNSNNTSQNQAGNLSNNASQNNQNQVTFKEKVSGNFKAGYEAGKAMANQGIENVKQSLKSGFSPKNLLVTAGITVAVDLATQIMRGEKPSAKKALKTICSAEFAGGVIGSVTGAAAGSFFVPFLSAVPVVGGVLAALAPTFGSVVGGSVGAYLAGDLKNGRFSLKEAFKRIDWVGVTGQTIGSTIGATLGSALGPIGTIIGGMVGGYIGNWAAHKIADAIGIGKQNQASPIAMPVGTNPYGDITPTGPIKVGDGYKDSSNIKGKPVSKPKEPVIVIDGSIEPIGTYASEVQLAYSRYQELYELYKQLITQGKKEEALKVAAEMNKAKAEYDRLRANAK